MGSLPYLSSTFTGAGEVEAIGEGVSGVQVSWIGPKLAGFTFSSTLPIYSYRASILAHESKMLSKIWFFFAPSFRELGNVWLSNKYIRLETLWYLVGCLTVASVLSVSILGVTHISLFSLIPQHFQWAKSISCITKFGKIWWYDGWYWFITFMWKLT